ncbi:MAG: methyltransferase domain-containing protein [Proteobacteria bacterium]|nr:methyltransferase domain-containing protein [Pseudomonadota bacterium]MDA0993041.1 methyltransferase domain-containing protein [Pseudomonadota bacterium]
MGIPTLQDQIDGANAYEALFVAALFEQWAHKVADAARIQHGERVLDVACGTGILAREVSKRTGSTGHVAGVDPGPGMIAVARQRNAFCGQSWRASRSSTRIANWRFA